MVKKVLLEREGNGIYFVQGGLKYNLYDLQKYANFVIEGSLDLSNMGLTELPNLAGVEVRGDFDCSHNNLTSLRGAPRAGQEGSTFNCGYNKIRSLKHLPMQSAGNIYGWRRIDCNDNQIETLKDLDLNFVWNCAINCANNQLKRLELSPMVYLRFKDMMARGYPLAQDSVSVSDFSGNPCVATYEKWLKHRYGVRGKMPVRIGVFDLHDANIELFDNSNSLIRGLSDGVNRIKFNMMERKFQKEHEAKLPEYLRDRNVR